MQTVTGGLHAAWTTTTTVTFYLSQSRRNDCIRAF